MSPRNEANRAGFAALRPATRLTRSSQFAKRLLLRSPTICPAVTWLTTVDRAASVAVLASMVRTVAPELAVDVFEAGVVVELVGDANVSERVAAGHGWSVKVVCPLASVHLLMACVGVLASARTAPTNRSPRLNALRIENVLCLLTLLTTRPPDLRLGECSELLKLRWVSIDFTRPLLTVEGANAKTPDPSRSAQRRGSGGVS